MSQMITLIQSNHIARYPNNLLMHFNGANNTTLLRDDSGYDHTFTSGGSPVVSTMQSKFGGSALYMDGSSHLLGPSGESLSEFTFGKNDFTVDFWYQFKSSPPGYTLPFDCRNSPSVSSFWIEYNGGIWRTGFGQTVVASSSASANVGVWQHIAVTRSAGWWRLFVDGVNVGNGNNTVYLTNNASRPAIGTQGDGVGFGRATCYMDELRVINGTAVWNADFTPSAIAYGVGSPGTSFDNIISTFAGTDYSLYDFRPGTNSIYSDNAGSVSITTSNVPIAYVKDLGTKGRHLTQVDLNIRPLSNTITMAAMFNGVNTYMDTTSTAMSVQSAVAVIQVNTGSPSSTGVVTNQSDQGTNVDFIFAQSGAGSWDTTQNLTGNGLAKAQRLWQNGAVSTSVTADALRCYSADAKDSIVPDNLRNLPNGLRIGADRNYPASRTLLGQVAAVFIYSSRLMTDDERGYVERTFNNIFSLGF